jgi:hypothetical protein
LPYQKLYRNRQDANEDFQPRGWYVEDARNVSWVSDISIMATAEMPVEGLSGFVVRHRPEMGGLRHKYTIVVAEGLDTVTPYMERFVVIKELMHCYFESDHGCSTGTQMALETHMRQFFGQSATTQSLHVQAEYRAFWMAMGVLCPEQRRVEYRRRFEANSISIEDISNALRTPTHIVRQMLTDQFEDEIRAILN